MTFIRMKFFYSFLVVAVVCLLQGIAEALPSRPAVHFAMNDLKQPPNAENALKAKFANKGIESSFVSMHTAAKKKIKTSVLVGAGCATAAVLGGVALLLSRRKQRKLKKMSGTSSFDGRTDKSSTKVETRGEWTKHLYKGRAFYHNSITKQSVWEAPAIFQSGVVSEPEVGRRKY